MYSGPGRPRLPASSDSSVEKQRAYNRRKNAERKARQRPIHKAIIAEFLDVPCTDCGVQYPSAVMQPDHVRGKRYKISWYKDGNGSVKSLREELSRCEVRCANCHVLRHAEGGTCEIL